MIASTNRIPQTTLGENLEKKCFFTSANEVKLKVKGTYILRPNVTTTVEVSRTLTPDRHVVQSILPFI